jgi:hypothetical protein
MRYARLNVECQFWRNIFLVKRGHFWSNVLVKPPTNFFPKLFFSYQILLDASSKHKHSTFGLQILKQSPKYWFFLSFLAIFPIFKAETRPSTLKNLKSRRNKSCSYYSSLQFLSLSFPKQKRSSPHICILGFLNFGIC